MVSSQPAPSLISSKSSASFTSLRDAFFNAFTVRAPMCMKTSRSLRAMSGEKSAPKHSANSRVLRSFGALFFSSSLYIAGVANSMMVTTLSVAAGSCSDIVDDFPLFFVALQSVPNSVSLRADCDALRRVTSYFIQSYVPYPERNVIDGWVAVLTFERALRLNDHFV